ncbi:MAG: hypothetical protein COB66_04315 [Coxiella sp. (in: Bacteria)]|nr:MAG: hypothetical protein COB66_04315 [Coxiella sp. (in: g-proteobacteria)]
MTRKLIIFIASSLLFINTAFALGNDNRRQIPPVLQNTYFGLNAGYLYIPYSNSDLKNNVTAKSVDNSLIAIKVSIGHYFNKYLALQLSYLRPIRWVKYHDIQGSTHSVWLSFLNLSLKPTLPLSSKFSIYGQLGGTYIARRGFTVQGQTGMENANMVTLLAGAGAIYNISKWLHLDLGLLYTAPRHHYNQPYALYLSSGLFITLLPDANSPSVDNDHTDYIFPHNLIYASFANSNVFYAEPSNIFSSSYFPVFWNGKIKVSSSYGLYFERNIFHTDRTFSLDWGASVTRNVSRNDNQTFYTASLYPEFKVWILRTHSFDFYFTYSVAGPTYISRTKLDGKDAGTHLTFQDFMGLGAFIGSHQQFNISIKMTHFSNGNLFTSNPGIALPLTINAGYTF